jgi:hypothetical protein
MLFSQTSHEHPIRIDKSRTAVSVVDPSGREESAGGEVVVVKQANGCERLMRWGTGALVLLLAHGLGAPGVARAGCNHLATSQSDRRLDVNRLDDLITGGLTAMPTDEPGQPGPARPRRCSGPGCSSGVPWPLSTTSPSSGGPDHWVALEAVLGLAVTSPPRHLPEEPAARPAGSKPSIFHPPPA